VGLALNDRHSSTDSVVPETVGDPERYQLAAAQLAIDSDVEQSEIAEIAASSRRVRMAQTCLGRSRHFCPTRRPLFQSLRFGVKAGS
jgi:hypothetical protein